MELLDCALIGVYAVIRSNTIVSFSADRSKTVPLLQFFSLRESAFVTVTFFFIVYFSSIRLSMGCASRLRLLQISQNTGYTDIIFCKACFRHCVKVIYGNFKWLSTVQADCVCSLHLAMKFCWLLIVLDGNFNVIAIKLQRKCLKWFEWNRVYIRVYIYIFLNVILFLIFKTIQLPNHVLNKRFSEKRPPTSPYRMEFRMSVGFALIKLRFPKLSPFGNKLNSVLSITLLWCNYIYSISNLVHLWTNTIGPTKRTSKDWPDPSSIVVRIRVHTKQNKTCS